MRELRDENLQAKRADMQTAIAEGRLITRQMTKRERSVADARRAAVLSRASKSAGPNR
jgi:hypothetical protein